MNFSDLLEQALRAAVAHAAEDGAPPKLAEALRYAVFPGGARARPRLCLAVSLACGDENPDAAVAAAASIELMHCASLVHDDLPCFDAAAIRRGKPSVHCAYGEATAVLAGDALIVLAFETLARGCAGQPDRLAPLLMALSRAAGMPTGIAGGQAWECEPHVDLASYHRSKTGSLFTAAAEMGAIASGGDPDTWRSLGERLGEAYQIADDLRDVAGNPLQLGKPTARDRFLGRPNAAAKFGSDGAARRMDELILSAIDSIPDCIGRPMLCALVRGEADRLLCGVMLGAPVVSADRA